MGVSENRGYLYFRVLIRRILLFRVLYWGPLFSRTSHIPEAELPTKASATATSAPTRLAELRGEGHGGPLRV